MKKSPILVLLALAALALSPTAHAEDEGSSVGVAAFVSPTPDADATVDVSPSAEGEAEAQPSAQPTTETPIEAPTDAPAASPMATQPLAAAAGGAPNCAPSSVYAISRDGTMYELKSGNSSRWTAMPGFNVQVPRKDWQTELCTYADPYACQKPQLNSLGVGVVNGKAVWYALQRRTVLTNSYTYVPEIIVYRATQGDGWKEFGRATVGRAMADTWYYVPDNTQAEVFNQVIGGAVNPVDGSYWVLAYDPVDASSESVGTLDTVALLYRVDPTTGKVEPKGRAEIPRFAAPKRGGSNGDLYFDADGNAHIVQTLFGFDHGNDHTNLARGETQVHIVRAADLGAARADTRLKFTSGKVVNLTGLDQNTGVAYEFPSGNVIISDLDSSVSFDPADPSKHTRENSGLRDSMDLASCGFPHTVELHKNVVGRVRPGHQFDLSIARADSAVIASEVTSGTTKGVQAEHVGPLPATPGAQLILSETLVGGQSGDSLAQYSPTMTCEETSYRGQLKVTPSPVAGQVGRYAITMPKLPEGGTKSLHVSCTITNTPASKPAQVKVIKKLRPVGGSADGADDKVLADWPFTIEAGTATLTPKDTTLKTGADGSAQWSLPQGTVGLSENLTADGKSYRFVSGSCERNGKQFETAFNAKDKTVSVSNLKVDPGDQLTCTFVNQEAEAPKGSVAFTKVDPDGNPLAGSAWTLTGPDGQEVTVEDCVKGSASECSGLDKDPAAGAFRVADLTLGDYVLREKTAPAGYFLSTDEHKFSISAANPNHVFKEAFINNPITISIPLTGGAGAYLFTLGGLGLVGLGVVILLKRRAIV